MYSNRNFVACVFLLWCIMYYHGKMSTFTFIAFSILVLHPPPVSYLRGFSSLLCRWYPSIPICLSTDVIWYEYESSQPTKVTRGLGVMFMANYPPLTILCCPPSFLWASLPSSAMKPWDMVQSVAAHQICNQPKRAHVTSLFINLYSCPCPSQSNSSHWCPLGSFWVYTHPL